MARQDFQCPFCGLPCFRDDEALTVGHEEPVCAQFHASQAQAFAVTRTITPEELESVLAEHRERVRKGQN